MLILYIGKLALYGAFLCSIISTILQIKSKNSLYAHKAHILYASQITISLLCIICAFVTNDFSLKIVADHSHTVLPLIYKYTAIWGTNSGSLLLLNFLVLISAIFVRNFSRNSKLIFLIICFLLTSLIVNSSPFIKNTDLIQSGKGFNPLLQDIGIAIHPPILYFGNALQFIIFALHFDIKSKFNIMQINRISWCFLTLGLTLGSWWAYRELGWGGIWFWDPVENLSLLPWLASTALLHMRNTSPYSLSFKLACILGAFSFVISMSLIRLGLVDSVHSFANNSKQGFIFISVVLFFGILALKSIANSTQLLSSKKHLRPEYLMLSNSVLLLFTGIILLGSVIFAPIYQYYSQNKIELSSSFYTDSLTPLCVLLCVLIPFAYKNKIGFKFLFPALISFVLWVLFLTLYSFEPLASKVLLLTSINVIVYSIFYFKKRSILQFFGHIFLGVLLISVLMHYNCSKSKILNLNEKEYGHFGPYKVKIVSTNIYPHNNYIARETTVEIHTPKQKLFLKPEVRFFPVENMYTVESDIVNINLFDELYVTSGSIDNLVHTIEIKLQSKTKLIWISAFLLGITGLASYFKRRRNEI
ncbi:MAG: cytochrome c biogenesis protein CcsA [Rickettsiales bacterium]